mmetsp:Transcript_704/g.1428  ORF Transcript_704/g.1428 Transcript_704/m.1428 type:complete len:200 (-) Transcript_704:180-779(-)
MPFYQDPCHYVCSIFTLHTGLKRDHKLKYHGRLQYQLYLKGMGLTMEENILFFQREFTKIMTANEFKKKYSYNIRHLYGKEGHCKSKSPYDCRRIILNPSPHSSKQHHGCPYHHCNEEHLSELLAATKLSSSDREEILQLKKNQRHNMACLKHFELMHPDAKRRVDVGLLMEVGSHPNAWTAASLAYHHNEGTEMGEIL